MIRRLYVHNFRCFQNFDLQLSGRSSVLLIGPNGSGKTAVGQALQVFQKIARGTNRVRELVSEKDIGWRRTEVPVRFELEVELDSAVYSYAIALELPETFKELRVLEENLTIDGRPVFTRTMAEVRLSRTRMNLDFEANFRIDWHLLALPIIQQQSANDPLGHFKEWLSRILILRPIPSLVGGESNEETLQPNDRVTDFAAWFSGLLATAPSAYTNIDSFLKQIMPDLQDIKNPQVGKASRSLTVQFSTAQGTLELPFDELSDGEKCFMICALVLAANEVTGPICCFWDEPDNYLGTTEIGHFVLALRRSFEKRMGQLITTSHSPEVIRHFSDENTLVFDRRSHLEPTTVRSLSEVGYQGDLVGALVRGDLRA